MIEKLINKAIYSISNYYNDEPYITIICILITFVFLVCCIKLFKYILLITVVCITLLISCITGYSYYKTTTLEYQLAQQMMNDGCVDTIDIEKYLHYENITFADGKQYAFGMAPVNSIVRNYVCHANKRTYSVDFLLDIYQGKTSLKQDVEGLKSDIEELSKVMNNKG